MQTNNLPYTLGLDIGIASVGWCVLGRDRIIDLGVRAFDKAETAKEGESLNLVRRTARLMRRRLRRRAWRLTRLTRLLRRHGLIADTQFFRPQNPFAHSLWKLRVEALDRRLDAEEWARVIYHLCKHRGFHWISRAEKKQAEGDSKGEGGKVTQGLAATAKLFKEKGYRSAAEMVLAEFPEAQRNKQGAYGRALARTLLADELALLFARQRELGNPHAGPELEAEVLGNGDRKSGLFWAQKPALAGEDLLKMLGRCTFERDEHRAPKASFTAERHVWLTRLNNLRIVMDGTVRPLSEAERAAALPLPYAQAKELTYKQLHDTLVKAGLLPEGFDFAGLHPGKDGKDPKAEKLVKLPAWQELRLALKRAGLETEWQGMAGAALDGRPELLDDIARVLSVYKDDAEVAAELRKLAPPSPDKMIEALLECPRTAFKAFHALSVKALRRIVPHMEAGLRYDEACVKAGYHHSQLHKAGEGEYKYLPPLYAQHRGREGSDRNRMLFSEPVEREVQGGIPRNPVVLRALNQARKVVNAIVRRYGAPMAVHIEMARDLSRPLDERRKIEKEQAEYRNRNEKDRLLFAESFGRQPNGAEFEKWRLYREQGGQCAYSLRPLAPSGDVAEIFDQGATEIDHVLPLSRSFDDSKNNKVLVLGKENRDKGNRTPYEYLGGAEDSARWRQFAAFVESNKSYRLAKRSRLLRKDFGGKEAEGFRERNLNDTRYICRFFKNYVERYLQLAEGSEAKRCAVISGQLTAFLRARWGLVKVRADNDRHHALDAAAVAACSHAMIKRLSEYARCKELEKVRAGFVDAETGEIVNPAMYQQLRQHFPDPWPHFRDELQARLYVDDPARLRAEIERLGTYGPEALEALRPLFVSRAPRRRNAGALHQDTIRSAKLLDRGVSYVKTPLQKLRLSDLEQIVGATHSHNAKLMALLRERLEKHNGDGKAAFAEPVYKPSAPGKAPIVRAVKLVATQKGGMQVRGGVANLGEMDHVDVYRDGNRFLIEPAYAVSSDVRLRAPTRPKDARFLFTLTKNDYIRVVLGSTEHQGYFVMYESDGRITLRAHDQPQPDKNYFRKSVFSASKFEKFHVDILGNIHPARPESRRELA